MAGMYRTSLVLVILALAPAASSAQSNQSPSIVLPTVIVTAQREAADVKEVPASVTAVTAETIANSGLRAITDAVIFAPNSVFTEFTARKVSNARFRGIGSSPANPAITTYLDGVPQLNSNSSNIELLDVGQIEFVRGPQSPLFGRNTLGGIVNVTTARPSMSAWTGSATVPFGNAGLWDARGNVSGPIGDKAAIGVAAGKQQRDGFTHNSITGHDLDSRDGTFAKAQALFLPNANWEARVIYAYERNRDGDYALGDLSAIRIAPFRVARDYEGFTNRDINNTTVNLRGTGQNFAIESTTGFIKWKTEDSTDLDYSPLPLATRNNLEEDTQFTQEIRIASPENAPYQFGSFLTGASLKWQAGIEFFNQAYDQDAVNAFGAFVLNPQIGFPIEMHSPEASIDSNGIGLFGRATLSVNDTIDVTAGLRFDHESSDAHLLTYFAPAIASANTVAADQTFNDISPQFAFGYRINPQQTAYVSAARGYKAGGFNPAALPGSEAYGEEHAWHVEGGVKSTLAGGKVAANAAVFFIDWDDLQLNVPNPFVPGQFYIANVGGARSRGVEVDVTARPRPSLDLFAAVGVTSAQFAAGTMANGVAVDDNDLPYTPDYTATFGGQMTRAINSAINGFARAEVVLSGAFSYDEANSEGQDAYSLVNLRAGARLRRYFADVWLRNAFDTRYVPIAIPYPGFAPSGFIGENGRPRTFGITIGATF
jgi:iron complex outermembrane receptor protein